MQNNKIVFLPSGRLGNAFFRYMACAVINIKNPSLTFCLKESFHESENKFTYYAGLDYNGHDYGMSNMNDIQMVALANANIMGYNTLGFLKHTIDIDKLISNDYINKYNGHGLYVKKTITLNDANFLECVNKKLENFNVCMDGFFQFDHIYLQYKPQILKYMEEHKQSHYIQTDLYEKFLMQDLLDDIFLLPEKKYNIVIHIRLGDFNGRPDYIELKYYFALFETIEFKGQTICLLCEPSSKQSDYIEECMKWFKCKDLFVSLESNNLMMDFNIMKQAKILVCSMSTLAWTAAYLSKNIQTCYMPNYNFYEIPDRSHGFFRKPIENTLLYNVKTTSQKMAQIKPYILTLPAYAETRLAKLDLLIQNLSQIGLETTIYNGVHGKDIIYDDETNVRNITYKGVTYKYDPTVRINGQPMKRGEFGCSWSHLNLLRKLVASNDEYFLIFEDDVKLVKPLNELYELLNHIPADTDICHLGMSDWYPFVKTKQINNYFSECEKRCFNRTTAYLISRKGAEKLLYYHKDAIHVPIDDLINMTFRLTTNFRFYVPTADFFFKEQEEITSVAKEING